MIEDWLLKDQEFEAENSRDSFIRKSIESLSKIIKNIRRNNANNTFIYKINSGVKLAAVIVNLILILISRDFLFLGMLNLFLILGLFSINKNDRIKILAMSSIFPLFTFIILIPSIYTGNHINSLLIFYKVFLNILCINIFIAYSSTWQEIINAFRLFFIPDIFIWIFELTIKYILLLGEYTVEVLRALKLRAVGKSSKIRKTVFPIMGNMFLTSIKMSEEMVDAMTCRGFTGEYKLRRDKKLYKEDYLFIVVEIVIIFVFIVL